MSTEGLSKEEQRRRRLWPIRHGVHTVAEVAALLAEGLDYRQIAARWGMRPIAGTEDLRFDIYTAWERAGSPGGAQEPTRRDYDNPEWAAWREWNEQAIQVWLAAQREGPHCPTCRCRP